MSAKQLTITLIPADGEPHYKEPERQATIKGFEASIKKTGAKVAPEVLMQKAVGGGEWLTGLFIMDLVKEAAPYATSFLVYLAAVKGRKIRVKKGELEIEAGSAKEVEKILSMLEKTPKD